LGKWSWTRLGPSPIANIIELGVFALLLRPLPVASPARCHSQCLVLTVFPFYCRPRLARYSPPALPISLVQGLAFPSLSLPRLLFRLDLVSWSFHLPFVLRFGGLFRYDKVMLRYFEMSYTYRALRALVVFLFLTSSWRLSLSLGFVLKGLGSSQAM